VASDLDVVREVAGDAAILVPPGDVPLLRSALEQIVVDEPIQRRLADAGRPRAARFSWEATADVTITAYHQALASCV
jgi:glycosyltransferase involved in cell wall biosynthesis